MAHHSGVPRHGPTNISVRTINLAAMMEAHLPAISNATATFVAVKLDIESAEFELLPHLLTSGVLCRVHLLVIEWHLNALPPERRLSGLGLRISLTRLLHDGCRALTGTSPKLIHEGSGINNMQQAVPGLWDVLLNHNGTAHPGHVESKLVRQWERSRVSILNGAASGR